MTRNPRRPDKAARPSIGLWDKKVAPFVERFALPLAICFILIGAARIVSTYRALSITWDEPYHFTCGLDYLATGRACAPENPPFQPLASALLPYLDGVRPDPSINARWQRREDIGREQMWSLFRRAPDPWRIIVRMRAGVLPFFLAAALVVFFGARYFYGKAVAVLSVALFTLIPPVLAHSGIATTDISLTATLGASLFVLAWWSEAPSWRRAAWLGLAFGLAVFSKFSAIPYLAATAALATGFHIAATRPSRADLLRLARERAPGLALAGGVAAFVLWAGCRFSFGGVEGWPAWLKVPAPELFAALRELSAHVRRGHPSYLLGEYQDRGWWYYYPIVLSVKTPIALMLAAVAGLFACRRRRRFLPVAFCLGILLVALPSTINIGVRHVLPVYLGLSVIGAFGLVRLARISVLLPAALVAWMAISGAFAHPNYLSYFNAFAGAHPEEIMVNSDTEWEQSWVQVGRLLRARGASEVSLEIGYSEFATKEVLERVYGFPPVRLPDPTGIPKPGWKVVDVPRLRAVTARWQFGPNATLWDRLAMLQGPVYRPIVPVARFGGLLVGYTVPDPNNGLPNSKLVN